MFTMALNIRKHCFENYNLPRHFWSMKSSTCQLDFICFVMAIIIAREVTRNRLTGYGPHNTKQKLGLLVLDKSTRFKYPRTMWNYPLFAIVLTLQNESQIEQFHLKNKQTPLQIEQ